jgi:hypothetical protein
MKIHVTRAAVEAARIEVQAFESACLRPDPMVLKLAQAEHWEREPWTSTNRLRRRRRTASPDAPPEGTKQMEIPAGTGSTKMAYIKGNASKDDLPYATSSEQVGPARS